MKKILLIALSLCALSLNAQTNQTVDAQTQASVPNDAPAVKTSHKQTVVLQCDLHCKGCCDKIMKNIAFEKGVKDIVCDLDKKTVTVTYDTRKTDLDTLLKAFERIGKPAKLIE